MPIPTDKPLVWSHLGLDTGHPFLTLSNHSHSYVKTNRIAPEAGAATASISKPPLDNLELLHPSRLRYQRHSNLESMSLIQSSSLPHATGFAIFHPAPSSSLSTWIPNVYNQQQHFDSSAGFCQTVPQVQLQARQSRQSAINLVNQTASPPDFRVIHTAAQPVQQPLSDDTYRYHQQPLANMAEYGHDHVGRGSVQYGQPYIPGQPKSDISGAVSQYSPPLSHQPLSHARQVAIPTTAHQAVPLQIVHAPEMNGYQTQPAPVMYARHPRSSDVAVSPQSVVMVPGDTDDGRVLYDTLGKAHIIRYEASDQGSLISPVTLGPWPLGEHPRAIDPGFGSGYMLSYGGVQTLKYTCAFVVPPTPLMESALMPIEQDGWQSQEPARLNTRAQVANMTESERVRGLVVEWSIMTDISLTSHL